MNELQLEAVFDREIANFGCREVCYPSIVASGNNACCLHYEENNSPLNNGDLLLIDAGAEYQSYCSDITRTWPINGTFTTEQTALYQLVLSAIDNAIALVKPGLSWPDIHQMCIETMAKGLLDLGILTGTFEQVMKDESYKAFTIHKTGHWLGMDVHDVGSYHDEQGHWITLSPNMIFTIEPGIYIPKHCESVDKKWRGIGIRIEDDILVTSTGCENLSKEVPRTIEAIERQMKG
jgi:Xaa-Pro aminopeptidase